MPHYPALVLHFDGGCQPTNPGGICTFGWHLDTPEGRTVHEEAGVCTDRPAHERTNNLAEWDGLCDALQWLQESGATVGRLTIRGDSQLVIRQLVGRWRVKARHLKPMLAEARRRIKAVCPTHTKKKPAYVAEWIPRERNGRADALAAIAYSVEAGLPVVRRK